ncbi:MAG: hypothetical protein JWP29_3314 [Rhodoferax sp.]|nr:hypothetical protein [Rhodoferax sp.]
MTTPQAAQQRPHPPALFYALIASLPFSDFLQTTVVAFSAAPVMGGIAASPEEYSTVATLYAVVAIGVIALHRQLLARLGWRHLLQGSAALYALGALVCGLSASVAGFAAGRMLMALGCGSFMTAGRVLVNHIPPSPRRFTGIKLFAAGLAWGGVAGPWLASAALAAQAWRMAFFALLLPAAVIGALAGAVVPNDRPESDTPAQPVSRSLLVLTGGAFLLLHALQRSSFDFFNGAWLLCGTAALAVAGLSAFVWLSRAKAGAAISFRPLAQRRYLLGLGMFALGYVLLGANSSMLPVLLQRALGLPLEVVGRVIGIGALGGVASWIVLSRLLPRHPGPTRYYLVGFGLLLCCASQLSGLSESANLWQSVVPALLCNGAFVIVVLATTAMQTFQTLQRDETTFSHANQVKNILGQFGVAAGIALATLCMQWRSSLHYARLGESLSAANPALAQTLTTLTQRFAAEGQVAEAPAMAVVHLGQWLNQAATLMGALDYFFVVKIIAGGCLAAIALEAAWHRCKLA